MKFANKGAGELTEVLLTVLLSISVMAVAFKVPEIINDTAMLLTLSSAERTALDLGGLITVSGAAQDKVTIYYENEDSSISYDLEIENRMLNIKSIRMNGELVVSSETTINKGWAKIGYGDVSLELNDVRRFVINKNRIDVNGAVINTYELKKHG